MIIYNSIHSIKKPRAKTAVSIGVFDGVHLGHQRILAEAAKCARKLGGKTCVITFRDHPDECLGKTGKVLMIKGAEAKLRRLKKCGVDIVVMLKFGEIRRMNAVEFTENLLLEKLNAACVVAGKDFNFGKGGRGRTQLLRKLGEKYGFKTVIIPDFVVAGKRVSSTLIRRYIKKGDIRMVERMLGRPYAIAGKVERGRGIGFEFKTANIKLPYADMPARGVWAVRVVHKSGSYIGAANIGFAPTLKALDEALLEVNILDFNRDIYGDEIRVIFLERLRDEKKFKSREALLEQVEKDICYIRRKYIDRRKGAKTVSQVKI